MKILHAQFTAKPEHVDEVAQMITDLAAKVRTEEGNILFDVYQHAEDPSKFFVMEIYRDEEAFQAHINMPYGAPFNARLEEIIWEPHSVLTFLNRLA